MTTEKEATAERFAARLRERLPGDLRAVVLYGSVARGDARDDSDVDLLVVVDEPSRAFEVTGNLAYEIAWEGGFRTLLVPIEYSPEQLSRSLGAGAPFVQRVLEEGKVLYDDGTISRLRGRLAEARA